MALAAAKTFIAAEVLFASDLNALNTNILNNALSLISPLTGSLDAGGFDITALDELAFSDADADATATGRLRRTNQHLEWHDATASWPLQLVAGGAIFGLTISNDTTDATNDIQVTAGQAIDDTEIYTLRLTATLIKQLDVAWAVGTNAGMLDTGAIANGTYHIYIIKRSDTGVTDILASTSATAPTMPTSYDFRRRIAAILRESAAIVTFSQVGDEFLRGTPVLDVNTTNPGTAAVLSTLSVPTGIQVGALVTFTIADGTPLGVQGWLSSPDQTDNVPTSSIMTILTTSGTPTHAWQGHIRTNTVRQVRYRLSGSDASMVVRITAQGWLDPRGRNV